MTGINIIVDILVPLLAGLVLFIAIIRLVARLTGWTKLAAAFPDCVSYPPSEKKRWQSLGMGRGQYNHVAVFEPFPTGLRISLMPPFQLSNPPLFIPWTTFRLRQSGAGFFRQYAATLPDLDITLKFDKKAGEWIAGQAGKLAGIDILTE